MENHAFVFRKTIWRLVLLPVFAVMLSCDDDFGRSYPAGCTVAVVIEGISPDAAIGREFRSWVMERLVTFSKEKQDFSVDTVPLKSSGDAPEKVTHIFEVRVDSLNLISYQTYQKDMKAIHDAGDKFDTVMSRVPGANSLTGMIIGAVFTHASYNSAPQPALSVTLTVTDRKTKREVWSYDKRIEIESTAAMPENEQLGQLLAAVKSLLLDEVAFFLRCSYHGRKILMWGRYPPRYGPALIIPRSAHSVPVLRYPLKGGRLDKVTARPNIVVAAPTETC